MHVRGAAVSSKPPPHYWSNMSQASRRGCGYVIGRPYGPTVQPCSSAVLGARIWSPGEKGHGVIVGFSPRRLFPTLRDPIPQK